MRKTHYDGGVVYANGNRLPGWAVCSTGEKAEAIRRNKNQTRQKDKVDCLGCLKLMKQQEEFKEENPEIWANYRDKGYCV